MSRRSALAALVLFTLTTSVFAADVSKLIATGDEATIKFNLPEAITAYKNALRFDSKNYGASWRLARALADTATLETDDAKKKLLLLEAQDYARWSVKFNAEDPKGHTFLSVVVGKLAMYEGGRTKVELSKEVKTEAEKAIALNPKEDIAYAVLGIWNREMVQLNWFLKKFAEVLYGSFPPASMDDALKDLRHATELQPKAVAHQAELGITLAEAGQWAEAEKTLSHALVMPKTWVTDDIYREKAREMLKTANRHLH